MNYQLKYQKLVLVTAAKKITSEISKEKIILLPNMKDDIPPEKVFHKLAIISKYLNCTSKVVLIKKL